ncbi:MULTISPECIES: pirin family protein [unclassified Agarivorans]|uniref:pirin family protein n=1 Tax=unclassified Agarivorans TaxID=2636026 RepID=UPI0026E398DA|nr:MULTISPECIES: pirin family protein [unclassified Agarivorans]MDO6685774.1 pirin family protein [Agarivorans sp. 3_MG-2023]MDO6716111.1 pirin family protein [Agarivorans sp. 2_MG-2023]
MQNSRQLEKVVVGQATSDGAGVKLTRMLGNAQLQHLDPFLMLDCFESDKPDDYLAGFPEHPHRGFQTVTYILNGRMRHKDNAGHESVIEAGGVQWMNAGRGVIHSEMPEQENGLLKGFQLWVNLAAEHKMSAPGYQELSAEQIPVSQDEQGNVIRVVAGELANGIKGAVQTQQTTASYLDISLVASADLSLVLPAHHHGFVYVIEGEVTIGQSKQAIKAYQLGVLSEGDELSLQSQQASRVLVVTGEPINQPIAWGGPFVMNTREEVLQAFDDFQNNKF